MKKIILTSAIFINAILMNAQTIKVYEYDSEGNLSSTPAYTSSNKVKVVFEESVPDYKSQSLNTGDKVEGKIIVEGDTLTKGVGGTVADYVDLGITVDGKKVLWATHNLGASKPEEYGAYIAWGENGTVEEGYSAGVKMKDGDAYYDGTNLKYCSGTTWKGPFTKYLATDTYDIVDNKTTLESEDDAATVNWGSNWRTPTDAELTALRTNCTWTWYTSGNTEYNGITGYKVVGTNGNSIFLPAAGWRNFSSLNYAGSCANYWSGSLDTSYSHAAYDLYFSSSGVSRDGGSRYGGQSLRPVYSE